VIRNIGLDAKFLELIKGYGLSLPELSENAPLPVRAIVLSPRRFWTRSISRTSRSAIQTCLQTSVRKFNLRRFQANAATAWPADSAGREFSERLELQHIELILLNRRCREGHLQTQSLQDRHRCHWRRSASSARNRRRGGSSVSVTPSALQ
jgi:hypothetical protein